MSERGDMIAILAATSPDAIDLRNETAPLNYLIEMLHAAEYRPTEVSLAFEAIVATARALRAERTAA